MTHRSFKQTTYQIGLILKWVICPKKKQEGLIQIVCDTNSQEKTSIRNESFVKWKAKHTKVLSLSFGFS